MLLYGKYGIEKSDKYNFQVSRISTSKEGKETKSVVSYHGDLSSALRSLRKKLISDGFRNDIEDLNAFLTKEENINKSFEEFLSSMSIEEITEALLPPEKPKKEEDEEEKVA